MSPVESHSYQLDIYASTACWRGIFKETRGRRISEVLNDRAHPFMELEQAFKITWDDGSTQESEALGTVAAVKRNIIAIVVENPAQVPQGSSILRIIKTPQRVVLSAPPVEVIGNIHLAKGAELFNVLEGTHLDFLPLTCASVRWLDGRAPLPNSAGLIFIKRETIVCIKKLPADLHAHPVEAIDISMEIGQHPMLR
jgi:hypothetical protein